MKGKTYILSKWFKLKSKEVETNAITWQKAKAIELKSPQKKWTQVATLQHQNPTRVEQM